jgi:hypothetical protein
MTRGPEPAWVIVACACTGIGVRVGVADQVSVREGTGLGLCVRVFVSAGDGEKLGVGDMERVGTRVSESVWLGLLCRDGDAVKDTEGVAVTLGEAAWVVLKLGSGVGEITEVQVWLGSGVWLAWGLTGTVGVADTDGLVPLVGSVVLLADKAGAGVRLGLGGRVLVEVALLWPVGAGLAVRVPWGDGVALCAGVELAEGCWVGVSVPELRGVALQVALGTWVAVLLGLAVRLQVRLGVAVLVGLKVAVGMGSGMICRAETLGRSAEPVLKLMVIIPPDGAMLLNTSSTGTYSAPAAWMMSKFVSTGAPLMATLKTLWPGDVKYISANLRVTW